MKPGLGFLGGDSTWSLFPVWTCLSLFAPLLPGVLTSSGTWPCSSTNAIAGGLAVVLTVRGGLGRPGSGRARVRDRTGISEPARESVWSGGSCRVWRQLTVVGGMEDTLRVRDDADYVLYIAATAGKSVQCGDMIDSDGGRGGRVKRLGPRRCQFDRTMVFQCWIVADSQVLDRNLASLARVNGMNGFFDADSVCCPGCGGLLTTTLPSIAQTRPIGSIRGVFFYFYFLVFIFYDVYF